jgi:hypothetical protein
MRQALVPVLVLALCLMSAAPVHGAGSTFYVSPTGSDANPGTLTQPWSSFYHAADSLQQGDTAIFLDGTYTETQYRPYATFASPRVTIRAQHARKATLNFTNKPQGVNSTAIWVVGTPNVTIRDMVITQPQMGSDYNDGLVRCWSGADNCHLINDVFSNAYQPVKFNANTGSLLDHDLFTASNVAFGAFGAGRPIIRYTEFRDAVDSAIQTKGGTVDAQVYGNLIRGRQSVGIYVGGGSCGAACGVTDVQNGYEGDHVAAWDNIVLGGGYGAIVVAGCNQCSVFNNDVLKSTVAVRIIANHGWLQPDDSTRYVPTVNPLIENNIISMSTYPVFYSSGPSPDPGDISGSIILDYNDCFACGSYGLPAQAHPILGDPLFVNLSSDWHLRSGSPAIAAGTTVSLTDSVGQPIHAAFTRDDRPRSGQWNMGAY